MPSELLLVTASAPLSIRTPPVRVLAPDSVSVPVPVLVSEPLRPEMTPLTSVLVLRLPTDRFLEPS